VALVHLRRPSRLSTLQLADTQPFDDPAGRYSFSHNGDLRDYRQLRAQYREQGRIHGRADTEVGARWLEDAWHDGEPPAHLLGALHDRFGGQANLAVLTAEGTPHHYAGNTENPVFSFRLGRIGIVSTGIYSLDRSIFRFVAPRATDRRMVHLHTTVALDRNGDAIGAS
jgi:glutamine phosphoribosylpyrophosphate amidotransferase